jgi:ABC-type glycerol-3-phosphate transport system substrate-binding protein
MDWIADPLRRARWLALVAVSAGALAACGSSGSSSSSSSGGSSSAAPVSRAALLAGSKHEQGLMIFSNALTSQMQHVVSAFEKQYPWIHVTFTDDEDPVVFSKYAAEHATGTRTADILIASAPGLWAGAVQNGVLDRREVQDRDVFDQQQLRLHGVLRVCAAEGLASSAEARSDSEGCG